MADITRARYGPYQLAAAVLAEPRQDPIVVLESRPWPSDVGVQLARTDAVFSERHLVASFYAAATTMMTGAARSRRIEVEFLLRLTARRQIADALRVAGLVGGESEVLLVVISWGTRIPRPGYVG
jgi:tRNA threonylcarbamoyladenosine modification (KEOPS) complex Cgi121 subunit